MSNNLIPLIKLALNSSFNFLISSLSPNLSNNYKAKTIGKEVEEAYSKQPVGTLLNFLMASKIKEIPTFF